MLYVKVGSFKNLVHALLERKQLKYLLNIKFYLSLEAEQ